MKTQLDRELDALEEDLAEGRIGQAEYNRWVREVERDYRDAAEEAARDAYDRELDRW